MDDILGMFVWIPRYAYHIDDENYHTSTAGTIDILFLSGTTTAYANLSLKEYNSTTTENYTKFPDGYVEHPAFSTTDSSVKLSGIWVAKFEASQGGTGSTIAVGGLEVAVKPSVTSWSKIDVNNMSLACQNMKTSGNIHGFSSSIDSHMMTDYEWGAVAYLTQSDYGNKQISSDDTSGVWNNPNKSCITGTVGSSRDSKSIENASCYTYNDTENNGPKGSTTGNVYGIYDMSGCAWEYTASYLTEVTSNTYVASFNEKTIKKVTYLGTGTSANNYTANKAIYGNAIYETSSAGTGATSWNGNHSYFVFSEVRPFSMRGSAYDSAGVFSFSCYNGYAHGAYSFRPVLTGAL